MRLFAQPTLRSEVFHAPGPPRTVRHLATSSGAVVHALAVELVRVATILLPTALLGSEGSQVLQQRFAQVKAVHHHVAPHAIWPGEDLVRPILGSRRSPEIVFVVPFIVEGWREGFQVQRFEGDILQVQTQVQLQGSRDPSLVARVRQAANLLEVLQIVLRTVVLDVRDLRRLIRRLSSSILLTLFDTLDAGECPSLHPVGIQNIGAGVATLAIWKRTITITTGGIASAIANARAGRSASTRHFGVVLQHLAHRSSIGLQSLLQHARADVRLSVAHGILIV
mmetsp:Transcript_341/g.675  ORF Transcript_341/g.675 Transcript_341/m.675 type:complete len:281 (+) Transcript_341:759-1601(+)